MIEKLSSEPDIFADYFDFDIEDTIACKLGLGNITGCFYSSGDTGRAARSSTHEASTSVIVHGPFRKNVTNITRTFSSL